MKAAVVEAATFIHQYLHTLVKNMIIVVSCFIADHHSAKANGFPRPPFAHLIVFHQPSDSVPLYCERHHFFPKRSFKAALPSIASANSRFNLVFSSSSDLNRLVRDPFVPPNWTFHL